LFGLSFLSPSSKARDVYIAINFVPRAVEGDVASDFADAVVVCVGNEKDERPVVVLPNG
jgi:hypothetical protein